MKVKFGNSFSSVFNITETAMKRIGVFDPTLDVDAKLFINPFLVPHSRQKEFSQCAFERYEAHFTEIYNLVKASKEVGDKPWRAALRKFQFSEARGMSGTCLGYAKRNTKGHAFGPMKANQSLIWAHQVIELGVKDPELFSSLPLFEDGIGVDLISDMFTAITIDCIAKFNSRVIAQLNTEHDVALETEAFNLRGKNYQFVRNPFTNDPSPIILIADDILDNLPILDDPRVIPSTISTNERLRERVNEHIGELFKFRTKKDKSEIKDRALQSAEAFQTLLDLLKKVETEGYNIYRDPDGLLVWRQAAKDAVSRQPLQFELDKTGSKISQIKGVVEQILNQFQYLVEDCRLNRLFYSNGKPRHEAFAQMLFYAIASSYCDMASLDISPEADAGVGPVDFKFSSGKQKVLVEIKLSTNTQVVSGYKKQLGAYTRAEKAQIGYYIVIDVGRIGKKWERLDALRRSDPEFANSHEIVLIDGSLQPSASNR